MHGLANIIRLTLLALLLLTPWLFGGVWARVQWVLMLIIAVLLAVDLLTRFGDDDRPNLLPTAWLPVLAGLLLGLFQLVPWPPAVAQVLAPATVQWRAELTDAQPATGLAETSSADTRNPGPSSDSRVRRTIYAAATREYLALLTLALAVFVLASIHLVDRQTVLWFFVSVGSCGAALSFFGLVQRLSWNGKFYWVFEPMAGSVQSFGPFVNRNNAGGFLNLCLAAGLGLLVWLHWRPNSRGASTSSRGERGEAEWRSGGLRRRKSERRADDTSPRDRGPEDRSATADPGMAGEAGEFPAREAATAENESGVEWDATSPILEVPKSTDDDISRVERRSGHHRSSSRHGRRRGDTAHVAYASHSHPMTYASDSRRAARASVRSVREYISDYVSDLDARRLGALALVAFTAGGVLCTASRGSILALFSAAMITTAALAVKRGSRRYAVGLLAILIGGVALMSWAGQTEFVRSRFALMFEESQFEQGRLPNWMDALRAVPQFPVAGSGLGTYPFVYERYQERFLPDAIHRHAENQFIQAVVEGGLIALGLLIAVILLTAAAIVRLYRKGGAVNTALAIAGTFGLASQLVGGLFDFGLYIPSNTLLMAALSGIVIGRAALLSVWPAEALDAMDRPHLGREYVVTGSSPSRSMSLHALPDERQTISGLMRSRRAFKTRRSPMTVVHSAVLGLAAPSSAVTLLVGFLMLGCLFGSLEMNRAAKIESARRTANLRRLIAANQPEAMARAALPLIAALPQRWDDAQAHQHLALLLVSQYHAEIYHQLAQQQKASQAADRADVPETDVATPPRDPAPLDPELWSRASLPHLHGTLRQLERSGDTAAATALVSSEPVQQLLLRAARHFLAARQYAPTISRVHYRLAELTPAFPDLGDEEVLLRHAQTLSPGDATLWYWSGVLNLNSARVNEACECWRHSLLLSRLHLDEILSMSQGKLTMRQLLDQTLPNQADLLLRVAVTFFAGDDRAKFRQIVLQRAEESLEDSSLPAPEFEYTHAAILRLQGRPEDAAPLFANAILRRSNNLPWRYEYARLLIDLGRYDEAYEQVNYLIGAEPKSGQYQRLQRDFEAKRWRAGAPETP